MKKLLALSVLIFLAGCSTCNAEETARACTMIGCAEGAAITFTNATWLEGRYDFTVRTDARTYECRGSLPFKTCEGNVTCNGEGLVITESGCMLPAAQHSFHGLMLNPPPKHIAITVRHESGKLFHFESDVTAQCGYPNGRECDPEPCCSASLDVPVDWQND